MIAFKLLKKRKDDTLGPLFVNRKQRIPINSWVEAEDHSPKNLAHRPGWHTTSTPNAPHMKMEGRVWCEVEIKDYYEFPRPQQQGGVWYIANWMKILKELGT